MGCFDTNVSVEYENVQRIRIFSNCCRNRVADELYEYRVVSFKCCGFIPQAPDQILFPIY